MKESELERKVVEYCRKCGLLTYKFTSPSSRGVPDRIIIGKDKVMFMELKQPGKRPTPLQYRELRRIQGHGGMHVAAMWADDIETAKALIDGVFR